MRCSAVVVAGPAGRQRRSVVGQHRDLKLTVCGPAGAGRAESARERFKIRLRHRANGIFVRNGDTLVAYRDDPLGESMDCPLIVGAIVLQFHDPVETLGTVALTQELVVELHRLCNMRELVPVDSRPEPWHDGVHHLAAPSFVSNFATRESKPFSAAIITFEI